MRERERVKTKEIEVVRERKRANYFQFFVYFYDSNLVDTFHFFL